MDLLEIEPRNLNSNNARKICKNKEIKRKYIKKHKKFFMRGAETKMIDFTRKKIMIDGESEEADLHDPNILWKNMISEIHSKPSTVHDFKGILRWNVLLMYKSYYWINEQRRNKSEFNSLINELFKHKLYTNRQSNVGHTRYTIEAPLHETDEPSKPGSKMYTDAVEILTPNILGVSLGEKSGLDGLLCIGNVRNPLFKYNRREGIRKQVENTDDETKYFIGYGNTNNPLVNPKILTSANISELVRLLRLGS